VHIIVELNPERADEVNFFDICCAIFDTGPPLGLLGYVGRKSRGVSSEGTILMIAGMIRVIP